MAGLTPNGFVRKRLVDIKLEIEASLKAIWGDNTNIEESSRLGQLIGIFAEALANQWESQEYVYNSQYPGTAEGVQLGNVVSLNAMIPLAKKKSTVTGAFTGLEGTVITIDSGAKTDLGAEFKTLSEEIIGVSGIVDIDMEAAEFGSVTASAGTLTIITTPTYGLFSVTNALDAIVGRLDETDAELRERRDEVIGGLGQNNTDSLFGQLRNIEGVSGVAVINNGTDVTDENGIPPHRFESIIEGGEEEDIKNIVWNNTPQGIMSYGNILTTIIDAQGFEQEIRYTRPGGVDIYAVINLTVDSNVFPVGGEDLVKTNFVSFGTTTFDIGDDVILVQFYSPITQTPGILGVDLKIGLTPSPTGTSNILIDPREKSIYDISFVEVNIV
jgi:uncharacterized phage protein gp47/JayE